MCGADGADAEDAEGLAAQEEIVGRFPDAAAKLLRLEADPARGGEHQGEGVFGDDRRGQAGDVADDDAEFLGDGRKSMASVPMPHTVIMRKLGQLPQQVAGPFDGAA